MKTTSCFFLLLFLGAAPTWGQATPVGAVVGVVVEAGTARRIENATVTLQSTADARFRIVVASDRDGGFRFRDVPFGEYKVVYGFAGEPIRSSGPFTLSAQRPRRELGHLRLPRAGVIQLVLLDVPARAQS